MTPSPASLRSRAILVSLNISQWTARRFDKRATSDITAQNGAVSSAARVNKLLLPDSDELDRVHKKAAAIRQIFYGETLPWMDGIQLLPTANYLGFAQRLRREQAEWTLLVDAFVQHYAVLRNRAQQQLGALYDMSDYPETFEVAQKFSMGVTTMPLPDNDFRLDLGDDLTAALRADVERDVADRIGGAMQSAWQRLYERVKHIAEKLADPKAIFRDTLVENAREVCATLSRLNFADDPNLEALRQEVEAKLAAHHPDTLRHDPLVRRTAAEDAADIMARMSAFMAPAA